jgi:hypothetical protein
MKFMPLLFVALPLYLLAQTPPTAPPPTSNSQEPAAQPALSPEQALRDRAQKFYATLVAQKPRLSEEFVCEADKDAYYKSSKSWLLSAEVDTVTLSADASSAVVRALVRPSIPIKMDRPMQPTAVSSNWKLEGGQWCYVLPPKPTAVITQFGKVDFSGSGVQFGSGAQGEALTRSMVEKVHFSKKVLTLPTKDSGKDEIEIKNGLNGEVQLEVSCPTSAGLTCQLDKPVLRAGETARLRLDFHYAQTPLAPKLSVSVRILPFDRVVSLSIAGSTN